MSLFRTYTASSTSASGLLYGNYWYTTDYTVESSKKEIKSTPPPPKTPPEELLYFDPKDIV